MPLQHLQLLTVFQANDVFRSHGLADRHRRLLRLCLNLPRLAVQTSQRGENGIDDFGDLGRRKHILADIGGYYVRGHPQNGPIRPIVF